MIFFKKSQNHAQLDDFARSSRYLNFSKDLVWQVYELPEMIELGQQIAMTRGGKQLQFTRNWSDASGADLLLASGSLHYFDPPVYHMLAKLPHKPLHILINRSPLIDGPTSRTVSTVESAASFTTGNS
jgi:putative methyltransferase (TIGR04325 family)